MFDMFIYLYGKLDRFGGRILNRLRLVRLHLLGAKVGRGVRVYGRFIIAGDARNLCIGDGSTINEGVLFDLRAPITIGREVRLSSFVQIRTSALDVDNRLDLHIASPIVIGDRVWLASGVVISSGVSIGDDTVVGANAVVIGNIAPNVFAAGVPARPLRSLE